MPRRSDPRRPALVGCVLHASLPSPTPTDALPHALAIALRRRRPSPTPIAVLRLPSRRRAGAGGPDVHRRRAGRHRDRRAARAAASRTRSATSSPVSCRSALSSRSIMGPIPTDELGWYLVTDADPRTIRSSSEGWIAAGFEPDAFLAPPARPPAKRRTSPRSRAPATPSTARSRSARRRPRDPMGRGRPGARRAARSRCRSLRVRRAGSGDSRHDRRRPRSRHAPAGRVRRARHPGPGVRRSSSPTAHGRSSIERVPEADARRRRPPADSRHASCRCLPLG